MNIDGTLDEAYERLHRTGPEFEGWLSNHGPMAVESMVRRGHARQVHRWLDLYLRRLDDRPRGTSPLTADGWRTALGDPRRLGDWLEFFEREVVEQPWRAVLETWWPRLLPGIAAGATHGVIRTGHAVHTLLDHEDAPRLTELGQALGYWAARWQPVPFTASSAPSSGTADPASALDGVPRVPDQSAGINHRLDQLTDLTSWPTALAALQPAADAEQARQLLADLTAAAGVRYLPNAHGNPVMLVHAVTAPMAVLRTLPALPGTQWVMSLHAAWAASAAVTAAYTPAAPAPRDSLPAAPESVDSAESADEVFALAVRHQDEHVIKLADTCVDVHRRTGHPDALAAVIRAAELIDEL